MFQQIVLETEKLSFRYPGNQYNSVNNISLQIKEGSCLGVIGPNGAGKSTLISMLCGMIEQTDGKIAYYPKQQKSPQTIEDRQVIIKNQVALIPQEYAFYQELTVKQNLEYFIALCRYKKSEDTIILHKTLEQCQLTKVAKQKVSSLSGGYKRRLNIAIALSKSPKIIFLDEPTVGIDPISRKEIIALLQSLKSNGLTLIYTSHILNEIETLCDDVLLLQSGKAISINHLSNSAQLLSFELLNKKIDRTFLTDLGIDVDSNIKTVFQLKIKDDQQLTKNLNVLSANIRNIKNLHYSQNSIDQFYFDSLKAQ